MAVILVAICAIAAGAFLILGGTSTVTDNQADFSISNCDPTKAYNGTTFTDSYNKRVVEVYMNGKIIVRLILSLSTAQKLNS